jgi:uncharacterized protein YqeY
MIINTIREQIKKAMIAKDSTTLGLLRLVLGTAQQDGDESDVNVEAIIRKMIKSNLQTIDYIKHDHDLALSLTKENTLLDSFLPKSMSVEDVKAYILENNLDVKSQSNVGAAVGVVMKGLKGKTVQGGDVKKAIEEIRSC